jgi:glycosyltransferase involved in cell wall biosynthesis
MTEPDVSILVVSKDDVEDLPLSLASAVAQRGVAVETWLIDNASSDGSREAGSRFGEAVRLLALPENVGFAAAMNAGIASSSGRYVLALNPDCRLAPDFAATLMRRLDAADAARVGSASGRILRGTGAELSPPRPAATSIEAPARRRRGAISRRRTWPVRPAPPASIGVRPWKPPASRRATSTRTSSCTGKTRTWRCGFPRWVGGVSTFRRRSRGTGGAIFPNAAAR